MLELEHLDVDYWVLVAVEDVSFRAFPGKIIGVIGSNGAAKSTLVKAILGLIPVAGGTIKKLGNSGETVVAKLLNFYGR